MENSPGQNLDGMFLVRGVSRSDKDYSLSFVHNKRCYHYYIHCFEEDYFMITEGPKVHGKNKVIFLLSKRWEEKKVWREVFFILQ